MNMDSLVDLRGISNRTIAGDAHFFEDSTTPDKTREYLSSSKESEKLKGMKWLLAMLSKGRDVAEFFPDVVKNVVVKSVEVKKMVYIYLVHYADFNNSCREIALLSINSFQKDMAGTNQLIRGLALRVMTSIRVPDIIQIQLLAVRKCATDSSPYVRRCAATALTKIFALDPSQIDHLKQILDKLLRDTSTMVLGSAVASFNEICPDSYDILHRSYRKLCHLLADMDEWTQVSVLEVMTRYIRNQFTDPSPGVQQAVRLRAKQRSTSAVKGRRNTIKRRVVKKAFYSDEEDESDEEEVEVDTRAETGSVFTTAGAADTEGDIDPDHRLLLRSSLPLLKSRNSGVVLAVCALHYYCGSQSQAPSSQIGKALLRILRSQREIQYVVLTCINTMVQERPVLFRPFLQDFFVKGTDPVFNRLLKLEILTAITTTENLQLVLKEFQSYAKQGNKQFVCCTIRAIGRLADAHPDISDRCLEGLLHLLRCNKSGEVVCESVVVLRQILQQNGASECGCRILNRLVKMLVSESDVEQPVARASIVWLVGEFHKVLRPVAADVLRLLASGFSDEAVETRMQILNLAIKQSLREAEDEKVQQLMTYVLEMARYDVDTDVRDRARVMTAFMGLAPSTDNGSTGVDEDALGELSEHAKGVLLAPKLPPMTLLGPVDVEGLPNFTVGSLSSLVGHRALGYEPVPSWASVQPDLGVRDAVRYQDEEGGGSGAPKAIAAKDESDEDEDEAPKGFYGKESDDDDDSDDDDSDKDDSDNDDSDDDDSDEDDEDEDSSSDEEEEDEEEEQAARIPIARTQPARMSMRKVAAGSKSSTSSVSANPHQQQLQADFSLLDIHHLEPAALPAPPVALSAPTFQSSFQMPLAPTAFTAPLDNASLLSQIMESFPSASTSVSPVMASTSLPTGTAVQDEVLSEPKSLLRPELSGGLSVEIAIRHGIKASVRGNVSALLTYRNAADQPIRRVRTSFPAEVRRSMQEDVAVLAVGAEAKVPIELSLLPQSGRQPLKVEVRCDKGTYNSWLQVEPWVLISPVALTAAEVGANRSRLGGFCESSASLTVPSDGSVALDESSIGKKVRRLVNLFHVQGYGVATASQEIIFTGSAFKGHNVQEDRVILGIQVARGGMSSTLYVKLNSDDALLCSSLMDALKKALLSP